MKNIRTDTRSLGEVRAIAPAPRRRTEGPAKWMSDFAYERGWDRLGDRLCPTGEVCPYCDRKAKAKRLVVHPVTLRRFYVSYCGRPSCGETLTAWEGSARQDRVKTEWELADRLPEPYETSIPVPTQFGSSARATIMNFLASNLPVQAVEGGGRAVSNLRTAIKSMGMSDEVYVDQRDGEAVLVRLDA